MVWPAANMYDDSKEAVEVIRMRAAVHSVAQLQLKRKHHPEHQLAHPAKASIIHAHVKLLAQLAGCKAFMGIPCLEAHLFFKGR